MGQWTVKEDDMWMISDLQWSYQPEDNSSPPEDDSSNKANQSMDYTRDTFSHKAVVIQNKERKRSETERPTNVELKWTQRIAGQNM